MTDPPQPNPTDLNKITPVPVRGASPEADLAYAAEKREAELEKIKIENDAAKQQLAHKKKYASRTFWLVASWIYAVFALLLLQGIGRHIGFCLSEKVLLAAITSTTVNVIGMLLVVLHNIFPERK